MLTIPLPLIRILIVAIIIFPSIAHTSDLKNNRLLKFLENKHAPLRPLLPEDIIIADQFRPSTQPFAGTVISIQGTAYVYHKDENTAYIITKDYPVFSGDTLVTGENSRVSLHLADDSTIILTSQSKLFIERSLPRVKVRDTTLHLFFGKVRSLVKKIMGEYIIETPTASVGVRGTDFIVVVAPAPPNNDLPRWQPKPAGLMTAILTGGEQSSVELAGLFGPSIMVKPFSAAGVGPGERAQKAVSVGAMAPFLLEKIAPKDGTPRPQEKHSPGPCWTFSVDAGGAGKKEYFEVCTLAKQPGLKEGK